MATSIREMIKERTEYVRQNIKSLSGGELSEILCEISSLYTSWAENLTALEQAYAQKKLEFLTGEKKMSVKEAEIWAETTEAYKNYAEARRLEKALLENIRSIKMRIRLLGNEYEISQNI